MGKSSGKKGIAIEVLGWWIIGLAVLALMVTGIIILNSKGISAIEFLKNIFRFGQ